MVSEVDSFFNWIPFLDGGYCWLWVRYFLFCLPHIWAVETDVFISSRILTFQIPWLATSSVQNARSLLGSSGWILLPQVLLVALRFVLYAPPIGGTKLMFLLVPQPTRSGTGVTCKIISSECPAYIGGLV
jgi:hypothetical protein